MKAINVLAVLLISFESLAGSPGQGSSTILSRLQQRRQENQLLRLDSERRNRESYRGFATQDCDRIITEIGANRNPRNGYNLRSSHMLPPIERLEPAFALVDRRINQERLIKPREEILSECAEMVAKFREDHANELAGEVEELREKASDQARDMDTTHESAHQTVSACNASAPGDECVVTPNGPMSVNIQDLPPIINHVAASSVLRFSSEDCSCADKKFNDDRGARTPAAMTQAKIDLEKKLNDAVIQAYGKRFINDFASNLEDLNYFLNERATVFNTADKTVTTENVQEALKYQCNQEEGYQKKITEACINSSVPQAERDNRVKAMLSSWGRPAFTNFNDHMMKIGEDVLTISTPARGGQNGQPYSRQRYDAFRATQASRLPGVIFADKITAKILSSNLAEKFRQLATTKSVEDALLDIIAEESLKANSSLVSEILNDEKIKDSSFVTSLKAVIASGKSADIRNSVKRSFNQASANHPGFKLLLQDKDKLVDFSIAPEDKSVIQFIEDQTAGGFIDQEFQERCSDLQKNLAAMVCEDPAKILSKFDPKEIDDVISHNNPELVGDLNVYNKLLCEKKANGSTLPLSLDHLDPKQEADYLARLKNPANANDRFSSHMRDETDPNSATGSYIAQTTNQRLNGEGGGSPRVSFNSENRIGGRFVAETPNSRSIGSGPKSSTSTIAQADTNSSQAIKPQTREESAPEVAPQFNYSNNAASNMNAVVPPVVNNNNEGNNRRDARSELREALSNDNNREQVNNLLSNVDNSAASELVKLREEALRSRQQLLEQSSQAEQKKLKELEQRLKDLQSAKTIAARNNNNDEDESEDSSDQTRRRSEGREIASFDSSFNNLPGGQSSSNISGEAGGAGQGSSASSARLSGSTGQESNAIRNSINNSGALVIASNSLAATGQSQEINTELMNFLTQNEPDISTLMNIKTSGMVYKFKVMENGVYVEKEIVVDYNSLNPEIKSLIEKKIAGKKGNSRSIASIESEIESVKRTHSYLSLKLLIGEQIRRK